MTGVKVQLRGYRIDKQGRLVPCNKHLDASARARQRGSKKVKVVKRNG